MAVTNFSPLLGLALPTTGDLSGTWGTTVNDSITQLLDSAVAGTTTLSADADVTLSTTNGAANQARNAVILWTASNGANTRNITAPAQSKAYIVINAGTGSIVLRGAGPTTGVTIVSGEKCLAAWNGSDFVKVASTAISNLTGTLPVANGGTGTATPALVQGSNITITGSWPNQTIAAAAPGTGTVTAVSVVSANGLAGTSSGGATPALTLSTSITGVLKGDGTAISAATAGTDYVTPTGTETLTNKTLNAVLLNDGYTEEVFAVTGTTPALSPTDGSIQTWTLSGNSTPTAGTWASGQSLTLMVDDDTAYTIDWSSVAVTWKTNGGAAPTLNTTGFTAIQLWKVDTVIYGARVGDA
jgi:hypothetical protein